MRKSCFGKKVCEKKGSGAVDDMPKKGACGTLFG